jgi:hypothetical protein
MCLQSCRFRTLGAIKRKKVNPKVCRLSHLSILVDAKSSEICPGNGNAALSARD